MNRSLHVHDLAWQIVKAFAGGVTFLFVLVFVLTVKTNTNLTILLDKTFERQYIFIRALLHLIYSVNFRSASIYGKR